MDTEEVSTGAVSRYLGLLAAIAGRFTQAAHHFEDALAMNQTTGALPWIARTQHDYAQLLLARNNAGDSRQVRELLGEARATCRELHIHPYRLNFTGTMLPAVQVDPDHECDLEER